MRSRFQIESLRDMAPNLSAQWILPSKLRRVTVVGSCLTSLPLAPEAHSPRSATSLTIHTLAKEVLHKVQANRDYTETVMLVRAASNTGTHVRTDARPHQIRVHLCDAPDAPCDAPARIRSASIWPTLATPSSATPCMAGSRSWRETCFGCRS